MSFYRIIIFILLCTIYSYAKGYGSFITKYEYGEMLYKNPRGVGCIKCHKADGEGGLISTYIDKFGKQRNIYAPAINKLSLKKFKQILIHQNYSKIRNGKKLQKNRVIFMPTYFLVDDEVDSLHYYITKGAYKIEEDQN